MDDQIGNSFASSQISNQQPASFSPAINNNPNTPRTFEFYFYLSLPDDTRIYHVRYTCTELYPFEIAQRLNNSINLHRPLIEQQIQQQFQQSAEFQIYQQNNIQQNNIQQDIEDPNYISGISGMGNYNTASTHSNVDIYDNTQDMGCDGAPDIQTAP